MSTHADRAAELLADEMIDTAPLAMRLQAAQAHATLALVDAIEGWQPPAESVPEVPYEFTKEGQQW